MKALIPALLVVASLAFVSEAQAFHGRRAVVVNAPFVAVRAPVVVRQPFFARRQAVVVQQPFVVRQSFVAPVYGVQSFAAPVYGVQQFGVGGGCSAFFVR
jgi:hypothetical protein